jgi:large repetitive protein
VQTTRVARRPTRLALALVLACGGALVGTAAAAARTTPVPAAAERLELTPPRAVARVDQPIQYTAVAVDAKGGRSDVTAETAFRFTDATGNPAAACSEAEEKDKAGQVTCSEPGLYYVTGEVDVPRLTSKPVELEVVREPIPPSIESADPNRTPPARDVVVKGTTGTCSTGELRLAGVERSVAVAGEFATEVRIPPGTVPGDHWLLLSVPCPGRDREARLKLVVENQPPEPADDRATTLPGEQVEIPVIDNDKDPDDPDGYATEVREVKPGPSRGTVAVEGKRIVYTPGEGFDRRGDQFDYAYCDVIGANRQTACGTATVAVDRTPPKPEDDTAITERGVEILIPVADNDQFRDDKALHVSQPPKVPGAEAVVASDHPGSISYKPARAFTGVDTFQYDYCPVVVNATALPACDSATVTVTVREPRVDPGIDPVEPDPSPPNREVEVKGTTGTCDKAATLKLDSAPKAATPVPVTGGRDGRFQAKLNIPSGTFVGPYQVELHVVCAGEQEVVEGGLRVDNQRPDAVNDRVVADATPGALTPIPVLDNDTDPDDPDGYETRVTVETAAAHGTAKEQGDQTIGYTAGEAFVDAGEDRFTYRYCEVVGARGQTDCDTATVTVVKPPPDPAPDSAVTVADRPVAIKVMSNDRNAGKPDIPKLQVRPEPAPEGQPQRQRDGTIVYRPAAGFTGRDSFQYDYCGGPNVINAAQTCPSATVTVDVKPPPQIKTVVANPTPPNREVVVTGTTGSCQQGTLTLRIPSRPEDVRVQVTADRDGAFEAALKVPRGTFVGTYELELRVDCDGEAQVAPGKLEVGNRPPDAVDDRATTTEGTPVTIDVTANDTDPDGDDGYQTSLEAAEPADGTNDVLSGDRIRYTPDEGFAGEDRFTYTLCEIVDASGRRDCDTATVTVTVIGGQDPVPVDDPDETTLRDQPVSILITSNDLNPDPDTLQVRTAPQDGEAVVQEQPRDGHILYTPPEGFTGKVSFQYDYCRSVVDLTARSACRLATVTVDVKEPPTPPKIENVTLNPTPPNREVVVTGTTGSCSQAGTLILNLPPPGTDVRAPVTGGQDGAFEQRLLIPGGTFVGSYRLELQVDCRGTRQVAEKELEVANKAPEAVDDPATTSEGTPVTIDVTANDTDPDGDDGYRTALAIGRPSQGTAEPQPGDRIRYTPDPGFAGVDRFTYRLCDVVDANGREDCGTATVTVTTTADPVISSVEPGSTPPGKPVKVAGNTGSCNPAGTLTLQGTGVAVPVTAGQDGGFTASLTVPAGTFPGPYRLELRVDCGGRLQRAEAGLAVTNQAPVAADDSASTTRDQPVRIRVTDNDRDPDDPDGHRTLVLVTRQPGHGTAEEQPDLTVVYTPVPGFIGEDRFTYSLCDDVLNAAGRADCDNATVTVTVTDVPVISSVEPGSTSPGKPVRVVGNTGSCSRSGTLRLSGAVDLREDVTGDQNGGFATTITIPEGAFPQTYELELTVDCNGQLRRAGAELTVANRAPVAADDEARTTPDASTTIDVTSNDRDPDDPDTYPTLLLVTDPPDHGTAEARTDLSIVYTPEPGFVGTDRFVYSLCDDVVNAAGRADCDTATVTVRVDPIACAPPAGQDAGLRVDPGRGRGGARLRIHAAVDPRLATCQFRLLLGGTPLAPDVSVGDDGSISAERGVPGDAKPGPSPVRLATLSADTLDEIPFEVVDGSSPASWPLRLLLGAGALLAGFLARAALRRWRNPDGDSSERRIVDPPDDLRAQPHTRPVEPTVEPVNDNTRTSDVRLEPHSDPGVQTVENVETVEEATR